MIASVGGLDHAYHLLVLEIHVRGAVIIFQVTSLVDARVSVGVIPQKMNSQRRRHFKMGYVSA